MVCLSVFLRMVRSSFGCCPSFIVDFEDVEVWSACDQDGLWFIDDGLLVRWDLAKYGNTDHGIDLYDDGRCPSHWNPKLERTRPRKVKESVEISLLDYPVTASVPVKPLQVGTTPVPEIDHQMKTKKP